MRFLDAVLLFSTSLDQLKIMMGDFIQKEHRKCRIEDSSGKKSCQPKIQQTIQGNHRRHQGGGLTSKRESKVFRTNHNVRATRDDRNVEQNQSSVGIILLIQARVDVEILSSTAQTSYSTCHDSHVDVRFWHIDTSTRTREIDSFDATQDAPSHRSNKEKVQDEKSKKKRRRRINERSRIGRGCKKLTKHDNRLGRRRQHEYRM